MAKKLKQNQKVVSESNFPSSTDSRLPSGFAALSLAGSKAAGLNLSEKELSILAREGSDLRQDLYRWIR